MEDKFWESKGEIEYVLPKKILDLINSVPGSMWWHVTRDKKNPEMCNYRPHELEILIKHYPLTQGDVQGLLEEEVDEVRFLSPERSVHLHFKGSLSTGPRGERATIYISENTREEQEITLIHELVHLHYRAGKAVEYSPPGELQLEDVIEVEAQRFYAKNRIFVTELFSELKQLQLPGI
ncbi:MAG: hypothetical protein IH845_03910 [Nanoarchaeota archaeon]|nr:hypothetical protein [Nanoarchaeota archaeon]